MASRNARLRKSSRRAENSPARVRVGPHDALRAPRSNGLAVLALLLLAGCGDKGSRSSASAEASASAKASSATSAPALSASAATAARTSATVVNPFASEQPAVASASAAPAAGGDGQISLTDLFDKEDANAAGIGGLKFDPVDSTKAPVLGAGSITTTPVADDWLLLPGNALQIPNPKSWKREKPAGDVGYLVSPDNKAFILFTTFKTQDEMVKKADAVGKHAKISSVEWKQPKQVKLGPDALPAFAMGGIATMASGKARVVMLAVDSGAPDKTLAIGLRDLDTPEATAKLGEAVLLSMRKKR